MFWFLQKIKESEGKNSKRRGRDDDDDEGMDKYLGMKNVKSHKKMRK